MEKRQKYCSKSNQIIILEPFIKSGDKSSKRFKFCWHLLRVHKSPSLFENSTTQPILLIAIDSNEISDSFLNLFSNY